MKAIILAGGMATRLRPITENIPKCLLNVGEKTIIDRQIESLSIEKVDEIIVVTGYKSELLEQHLSLNHSDKKIIVIRNKEFETTGPAYGLWCASEYLGTDTILYMNGDLVCDHAVIRDIIQSHHQNVTAISRNKWDEEQVKVRVNDDRSVESLGKGIPSHNSLGEFVGATKISQEFARNLSKTLENLKKTGELRKKFAADAINETLRIVGNSKMYIQDVTNYRTIEIDTINDFRTASKMWRSNIRRRIFTLIKILSARIIHAISYIFPRTRNKIIFIGWHKNDEREVFADNSKYLFIHTFQNYKNLRPIWISQDKKLARVLKESGFESYSTYNPIGMWHALTSRWTIVDAHMRRENWQFSGRSRVVQLWHGKGMKKSKLAKPGSSLVNPELLQNFEFLIASSEYTAKLMADIFKVKESKVIITGLPRNDVVLKNKYGHFSFIDVDKEFASAITDFKKEKPKKIIAYTPTFRRNSSNPLDQIDLEKMEKVLQEINCRMVITLHPKFSSENYDVSKVFKNIKILRAGYDVYPILKEIDMLITDYSSIYADYLLLNKPIIFFTYDREYYEKETGLYSNFDDLTPGPHTKTFSKLIEVLKTYDDKNWHDARKNVKDILHAFTDGNFSDRVIREILNRQF